MSWNLLGHELVVERLRRDLAHDRVRHAYLFTGPNGIGKRTLAAEFARALLCDGGAPADRPCGQCRHCTLTARGSRLSVMPVTAAQWKFILGLE